MGCASASHGLATSVVLSAALLLPNITTDFLRMYPNHDLNCQKFWSTVMILVSIAMSLYTWQGYAEMCFNSFKAGDSTVDVGSRVLNIRVVWKAGVGLICVVTATLLKLVDLVNCFIPAPDIAHTRSLQDEYELLYDGDGENDNNDDSIDSTRLKIESE